MLSATSIILLCLSTLPLLQSLSSSGFAFNYLLVLMHFVLFEYSAAIVAVTFGTTLSYYSVTY